MSREFEWCSRAKGLHSQYVPIQTRVGIFIIITSFNVEDIASPNSLHSIETWSVHMNAELWVVACGLYSENVIRKDYMRA